MLGIIPQKPQVKVFRYSFSETIPIFFNRLKSDFVLVHFNVNIDNVLHSKYAIKFILKCTSHGGMYGSH